MDNYSVYATYVLKTFLAIIMGGVIGVERQTKNRPAGFRTHILVCLGAATIMMLSEQMFVRYYEGYGFGFDPTRLSAQVISGIGFLGAGTIIHFGNNVKGLTTAASLWTVAAIGLAIGAGYYILAGIVTSSICITLIIFKKLSKRIKDNRDIREIIIHVVNKPKVLGEVQLILGNSSVKVLDEEFIEQSDMEFSEDESRMIAVRVMIQAPYKVRLDNVVERIESVEGVAKVEQP